MSLTAQSPQPSLAWQFESSNVDYITNLAPSSTVQPGVSQLQGTAALVTNAPVSNTAVYFPGVTGSYMNLGSTSPMHFDTSTSNLFVEAWVNFSQNAFTEYITGTLSGTTIDDWGLRVDGTFNRFMFYHYNTGGSSTAVTAPSTTPVIQGTWYHVAASFATTGTNGTIYLYVNGVLQNSGGNSIGGTPRYTAAASAFIGTPSPLPGGWVATSGYIRDLRVVQGGVVPTATFTPLAAAPFSYTLPSYVTGSGSVVFTLLGQFQLYNPIGKYGSSMVLNNQPGATSTATYVKYTTGISLSTATGFTLCAWIKPLAVGISGNQTFISVSNGTTFFIFQIDANQTSIHFYGQNPYTVPNVINGAAQTVSASTWIHVAVTFSGTAITTYYNGILKDNLSLVVYPLTFNALGLGNRSAISADSASDGELDDLRVYNTALTAAQVQSVYATQGMPSRGTDGATGGVLDALPTAAAAFSMRRLSTAYTGPVVQVRRQSDLISNTFVSDFFGSLSNAQYSQTLQTFLSGTTGNILTWYDQSGNGRNATGTAVNIVPTSNLNVQWGMNPTNAGLWLAGGTFLNGTDFTVACTSKRLGTQGNDGVYGYGANSTWQSTSTSYGANTRFGLVMPNAGSSTISFNDSTYNPAFTSASGTLPTSYVASTEPTMYTAVTFTNTTQQMYVNGTASGAASTGLTWVTANTSSTQFTVGFIDYYGNFLGEIGELIIFPTALVPSQVAQVYSAQTKCRSGMTILGTGVPFVTQLSAAGRAAITGAFALRAVAAPTARAIQVRRSSDNATQDFWADRVGNLLTAPVTGQSLVSWLGGSAGSVVTWYNQVATGLDITQATSANQPAIDTINNKVTFNGSSQSLVGSGLLAASVGTKTKYTYATCWTPTNTLGTGQCIMEHNSSTQTTNNRAALELTGAALGFMGEANDNTGIWTFLSSGTQYSTIMRVDNTDTWNLNNSNHNVRIRNAGSEVAATSSGGYTSLNLNNSVFAIGRKTTTGTEFLQGSMKAALVFSDALSDADVALIDAWQQSLF